MQYLVLGLSLVVGLALMGRWLLSADPKLILRVFRWIALAAIVGIGLFIVLRGRLEWILYAAPVLLPFIVRWGAVMSAIRNAAKAARGPTPGQSTGVRTRYLAMQLDHDTGALDGEVLAGRLAGRMLSSLDADERRSLLDEVRDDPPSVQVLEAWLDRADEAVDGDGAGREAPSGDRGGRAAEDGTVSRAQALEILGLSKDATEEDIREAHRRLMMANHPDRGGSSWLAARINRAKDVLLGRP